MTERREVLLEGHGGEEVELADVTDWVEELLHRDVHLGRLVRAVLLLVRQLADLKIVILTV